MEEQEKTQKNSGLANQGGEGAIPLFRQCSDRPCLVIGGGEVAYRKAAWLLACGAAVRALAIQFEPRWQELERSYPEKLILWQEAYEPGKLDLNEYMLIFAACGDEKVNRSVCEQAKAANVPLNVADVPEMCDFFVPATIQRGRLRIAVSTDGTCPALAGYLRRRLEKQLPEWYGELTEALGKVRNWLHRQKNISSKERQEIMKQLVVETFIETLSEFSGAELEARLFAEAARMMHAND